MRKNNFRNIAIIAHVDHGKTTLVDAMLKQSGTFTEHEEVEDRVMDSMDLERERGITIAAKNTSIFYKDIKINIMDTPGHADFGGEVERSLNMVDGVLLLVDSSEGPLPQTRFVLKKALEKKLPVILVINKIDRPDRRPKEVIDEVYELFFELDADETQIEFPIIYTNAKAGIANSEIDDDSTNLMPLFDLITDHFPGPIADDNGIEQFLITNLDYDSYVGQMAIGRLFNGSLEMNKQYTLCKEDKNIKNVKFSALYTFKGLKRIPVQKVEAGDIIAIAGVSDLSIGDTISNNEEPNALPAIRVDAPTVSMIFYVNNSPFAGKEGKLLTARNIKDRLIKETLSNVSIEVEDTARADAFKVSARGELQLAVLIETMRREGFELMVSKPNVIVQEIDGVKCEPVEKAFFDVPDGDVGSITEAMAQRKGRMVNMSTNGKGRTEMEFIIPTRGLIGYRSAFMTDTKGMGILNTLFEDYEPWFGKINHRNNGALVCDREGKVTAYASLAMEDRGQRTVEIGTHVYNGMVVGERNKPGDLEVNLTKEKKLSNMRSSTADTTVVLRAPKVMTLDDAIEFISDDEFAEITPESIRIRKTSLDKTERAANIRKKKYGVE